MSPPSRTLRLVNDRSKPSAWVHGTSFEARVRDYMAAHTKRMDKFEDAIFKQREEINDRIEELSNPEMPVKEAKKDNKAGNRAKNKPIRRGEREEAVEAPNSQSVGYYLKCRINEKQIKGLVNNHREDEKRPFILGTPFLTTAKAVIKFDKGTITLRYGKSKISFHRIPESHGKIKKGIKNDIEPIGPTMTVNRLVLEWEERIKLHQEKKMEFDQWRSKNFKNKHPAVVKVKGELNEGKVT
ncbi:hypothetical protein Tco_0038175 [Tanacetum coccineum]